MHVYTRANKGLCLDLSARKVLIFNYRIIVEWFYNILLDNTKMLYASEGFSVKGRPTQDIAGHRSVKVGIGNHSWVSSMLLNCHL